MDWGEEGLVGVEVGLGEGGLGAEGFTNVNHKFRILFNNLKIKSRTDFLAFSISELPIRLTFCLTLLLGKTIVQTDTNHIRY